MHPRVIVAEYSAPEELRQLEIKLTLKLHIIDAGVSLFYMSFLIKFNTLYM